MCQLREAFREILDGNNGVCPRCCKHVEKLSNNSVMYHCDEKCSPADPQQRPPVGTVVNNKDGNLDCGQQSSTFHNEM